MKGFLIALRLRRSNFTLNFLSFRDVTQQLHLVGVNWGYLKSENYFERSHTHTTGEMNGFNKCNTYCSDLDIVRHTHTFIMHVKK